MFFRKKPASPEETTFKQRVDIFWREFAAGAARIRQIIEQKNSSQLAEETSSLVDALSPGLAWVYGPGKTAGNHSLTLTAEGKRFHRPLTEYWLRKAPHLTGWDFFAARQPGKLEGIQMNIGGEKYSAKQFWITPEVDEEEELVDIVAWCPGLANLDEKARWTVLFLWLDESLGEDLTTRRIGKIEFHDRALGQSFPLIELRDFIEETALRLKWTAADANLLSSFSFSKPAGAFPRGDMLIGHTSHPLLWRDYLNAKGRMEDPLPGSGAAYYFLKLPTTDLTQGDESGQRMRLQDLFSAELGNSVDGICFGGGLSREWSYIDLLLFDGRRSMERVMEILRRDGMVKQATLHAFAGTPEKILAKL